MNTEPRTFDLVYWISERYSIKLRKDKNDGPPWTGDPNMATVRYCNVHREDDAVTKWFRANWNNPDDGAWKFVLGRLINYVPTLASLLYYADFDNVDFQGLAEGLKAVRASGSKVFTSVYTISTCGEQMDKIDYVIRLANMVAVHDQKGSWPWLPQGVPLMYPPKLAHAHEALTTIPGLGDFLSGQVIADMKNTLGHPLNKATDFYSWCAPGPGSLNGLKCFFPNRMITKTNFHAVMAECRALVDPLVPLYIPRISAQDFQNCLCEFSKYYRVKYEHGHVRNKYHAHS